MTIQKNKTKKQVIKSTKSKSYDCCLRFSAGVTGLVRVKRIKKNIYSTNTFLLNYHLAHKRFHGCIFDFTNEIYELHFNFARNLFIMCVCVFFPGIVGVVQFPQLHQLLKLYKGNNLQSRW